MLTPKSPHFSESRHAFEVLPVPYPVIPWVAPKQEHKPINFRVDDSEWGNPHGVYNTVSISHDVHVTFCRHGSKGGPG